jgi:hypothetical protein
MNPSGKESPAIVLIESDVREPPDPDATNLQIGMLMSGPNGLPGAVHEAPGCHDARGRRL